MRPISIRLVALVAVLALAGCWRSSGSKPNSSDPFSKLAQARKLYTETDRPAHAERLIRDAIAAFKRGPDPMGLSLAYAEYGSFFRSSAVERHRKEFEREGFFDKAASMDNRFLKAVEYYDKAAAILEAAGQFDLLCNVDLNRGHALAQAGKAGAACKSYDDSVRHHDQYKRNNPDAKVSLPADAPTFRIYVERLKVAAGCGE